MINVIKFTFKELTKNKAYKLTTLFLVALIVIFFNILTSLWQFSLIIYH